MPRKNYAVSAERFVEVWEISKNASDAANTLGMPKPIMFARASGYRARGIKLKKMPRQTRRLNIEELNRMIESGFAATSQPSAESAQAGTRP